MLRQQPEQRVLSRAKQEKDWYKPMCDFIINKAIGANNKSITTDNIKAANGIIEKDVFDYVVTPLKNVGASKEITKNLPGQIRDVDFITPIREKNMGEYMQLPYNFHVKVNNPDTVLIRDKKLQEAIFPKMQEAFVTLIKQQEQQQQQGDGKQQPQQAPPDFKKFADDFVKKYIDDRAIKGQKRVNLLNDINNFDYKRMQGFYYWWATEEFYTYRHILNNQVYTDLISPLEGYPIDNGEEFVEDMDGFVWINKISINQFIDQHRYEVDDKDWEYIHSLVGKNNTEGPITVPLLTLKSRYGDEFGKFFGTATDTLDNWNLTDDNRLITRYICAYKTEKLIKILTYTNAIGEITTKEVDEEYQLDIEAGDISIKEEWINEFYLQKRFGDDYAGVYTKPQPCDVQRRDPNNKSICKSPFGGKKGIMNGMAINPVPRKLIPYLTMYRIFTLHMERTIAKYKGAIIAWPKSVLDDDDAGSLVDKYRQIIADSSFIYDNADVDVNTITQGIREVGGTQSQAIERFLAILLKLRDQVLKEAWDISNMNNARVGNAPASETASGTQQNLIMAKLGSALMIYCYNEALRREHQADLEWSKVAWIDGTTGTFTNKGTHEDEFVEINPGEDFDTNWGIYMANSKVDEDKLKQLEQIAFASAQNDRVGLAGKIVAIDNIPELVKVLDEYDTATKQFQSAMEDKKMQTEQLTQQHEDARQNKELASKEKIAAMKIEGDKEKAIVGAMSGGDVNADLTRQEIEEKLANEKEKLRLKDKELGILKEHNDETHRINEKKVDKPK